METIKITNANQFEMLVEELEKNPSLAKGFRRGTVPNDFKEQWENIAMGLNALGLPSRTDGWQKIWRDLKFKVKKKMLTNKAEGKATGGDINKQIILSPMEEAMANLLQFQKVVYPGGKFMGAPNNDCYHQLLEESVDMNLLNSLEIDRSPASSSTAVTRIASSTTAAPSTTTRALSTTAPLTTNNQNALKEEVLPRQKKAKFLPNGMNCLKSIRMARILTEISNSISSMKRGLRDVRDIQEKRYKLELEKGKREEELYEADIQIMRIELSIKEKELQLLNTKI